MPEINCAWRLAKSFKWGQTRISEVLNADMSYLLIVA